MLISYLTASELEQILSSSDTTLEND